MDRGLRAWAILVLGIMLIIVGAQGRFGSFLGALITPQYMVDQDQAAQSVNAALPSWAQGVPLP